VIAAEGARTQRCQVCRRPFATRREKPPFVCGVACADVYRETSLRRLTQWAVLSELSRRVGPRSVLCLTPVADPDAARAALPWTGNDRAARRRPVGTETTNDRASDPEETDAMSENDKKPNRGRDTADRTVFNADGTVAVPPSGASPDNPNNYWTQREWQGRDKDAGFYRPDGDDDDAAAEPVASE
jgi:hypothetical protein